MDMGGATNWWGSAATANGGIAISASDLSKLTFITGTKAGSETISISAQDMDSLEGIPGTVTVSVVLPPTVAKQTADQVWTQGSTVKFAVPSGTFTDPNGEALSYTATLANGQALPSWLSFDAKTETFSGVVPTTMETLSLKVSATDTSGLTASETFGVTVPAQAVVTGKGKSLVAGREVGVSGLFSASDASGQAITEYRFQATGGGTIDLGGAVNLASADEVAQGIVEIAAADLSKVSYVGGAIPGPETLSVQAKDTNGWSTAATSTFANTPATSSNNAPPPPPAVVANAASVTAGQSVAVSSLFTVNEFASSPILYYYFGFDPSTGASMNLGGATNLWGANATANGGVCISAADLSKVTFIAGTGAGAETVTSFVQDDYGLSNTASTAVTVVVPPTLGVQTADQSWVQGGTVNFTLPDGTFTDPNGEALTYVATLANGQALPKWLSFDTKTGTFSGTVAAAIGSFSIKVTATDASGLSVSESFGVTVPAAPPVVNTIPSTQIWTQGSHVSFALPTGAFTDPNGEALTYTASLANGQALPTWLSFNAQTCAFSGVVPTGASSLALTVTATDTSGSSASESFIADIPAVAPVVASPILNQTWTRGSQVSFALPAGTFTDPNGETLTYAATLSNGQALPVWLSFNGQTDTFSGTMPAGTSSFSVQVTATDTSGLSTSESFGVTVPAAAPTVDSQTGAQTWTQGGKVNFTLPAGTFNDPNGQALTYAATQSNGQALPSWLAFDAQSGTFSGTVPAGAGGFTVKVTATDGSGLSVAESFGVTVPAPPTPTPSPTPSSQDASSQPSPGGSTAQVPALTASQVGEAAGRSGGVALVRSAEPDVGDTGQGAVADATPVHERRSDRQPEHRPDQGGESEGAEHRSGRGHDGGPGSGRFPVLVQHHPADRARGSAVAGLEHAAGQGAEPQGSDHRTSSISDGGPVLGHLHGGFDHQPGGRLDRRTGCRLVDQSGGGVDGGAVGGVAGQQPGRQHHRREGLQPDHRPAQRDADRRSQQHPGRRLDRH